MLPYFTMVSFKLGPLTIYIWGLCVAIGFLAGIFTAYFVCKSPSFSPFNKGGLRGISPFVKGGGKGDFNKIFNLSVLLLIFGMLGARIFWWFEHLGEVKSFFDFINISNGGLSSLGGFIFAGIVLTLGLREPSGLPKPIKWKYLDILAISFIPIWFFSRLGCFLIHDHIGRFSNFFLAVKFPGGARFDSAFLEIILMVLIGIYFIFKIRKNAQIPLAPQEAGLIPLTAFGGTPPGAVALKKGETERDFENRDSEPRGGSYALSLVLIYSFFRFFLDFLRAFDLPFSDPRYFGLTLAQWGMAALFILGAILTILYRRGKIKLAA